MNAEFWDNWDFVKETKGSNNFKGMQHTCRGICCANIFAIIYFIMIFHFFHEWKCRIIQYFRENAFNLCLVLFNPHFINYLHKNAKNSAKRKKLRI